MVGIVFDGNKTSLIKLILQYLYLADDDRRSTLIAISSIIILITYIDLNSKSNWILHEVKAKKWRTKI